jgi:diamine N-acetyltransferase
MNINIRLATKTDFDQVGSIFVEENRFHAELVPEIIQVAEPIMTTKWFEAVLENPDQILFVAEDGQELAGVALFELRTSIDDPIFTPRKYVHLSEIAVSGKYRGRGVGRLLMEEIQHWTEEHRISDIELQVWAKNTQAISFYEHLGYQPWRQTMRLTIGNLKFGKGNIKT